MTVARPAGRIVRSLSWLQRACAGAARGASDTRRKLPSFFVIGPPRTASTWLHEVLGQSTLLPKSTKETRFFDAHFHRGMRWYQAHFPRSSGVRPMGEVAPTYFSSDEARQRIATMVPDAKVVCTFRHPVERVLSLYRLKRAYGMIPWAFEQAIVRDPELMASGKYATNLKSWRQALGADRVLATIYDDLRDEPQRYVDSLLDFIEAPRVILTPTQVQWVYSSQNFTQPRSYLRTRSANLVADWCKARRMGKVVAAAKRTPLVNLFLGGGPAFAEPSAKQLSQLYEIFRPEVEELEVLLNRDLSAWKGSQWRGESLIAQPPGLGAESPAARVQKL